MQPRPTAAEILAVVGEVLERDVVPALAGPVQHQARVAASLVAIVERELLLAADQAVRERDALQELLADPVADPGDLRAVRAAVAAALRDGLADDPAQEAAVWQVLLDTVRADLAIAKPGHDDWEGD